jgi:hypothetical protein
MQPTQKLTPFSLSHLFPFILVSSPCLTFPLFFFFFSSSFSLLYSNKSETYHLLDFCFFPSSCLTVAYRICLLFYFFCFLFIFLLCSRNKLIGLVFFSFLFLSFLVLLYEIDNFSIIVLWNYFNN